MSEFVHPPMSEQEMRSKLQAVREARLMFGVAAARSLWKSLGLPFIEEMKAQPREMGAVLDPASRDDVVSRFLATAVIRERGSRIGATELHRIFDAWAQSAGEPQWSIRRFSLTMKSLGYRSMHSNRRWWLGLRLRSNDDVFGHGAPSSAASSALEAQFVEQRP